MRTGLRPPFRDERGVTVMETLVIIVVMTVIMLLVTQIFALSYDVFYKQGARIEVATDAALAARAIAEAARGATRVVDAATINGTAYASSADTLVLELPSVDAASDIIVASFDMVAFTRDATDPSLLIVDTEAAAGSARVSGTRVLAEDATALVFRYNDPVITDATRVSALFKNERAVRGASFESTGWSALSLRNN